MPATHAKDGHEFYSMLREREAQARAFGARHLCAVRDTNSMLYWLAEAAERARISAGRLQVHVAASASVNQSTIDRFESHSAWPRDADEIIEAYADDLDVEAFELWEAALGLWREHRALSPTERAAWAAEQAAARTRGRPRANGKAPAARRRGTQDS